jgi:hypothetical protein
MLIHRNEVGERKRRGEERRGEERTWCEVFETSKLVPGIHLLQQSLIS